MTFKLASLTLLAALTSAATAQTTHSAAPHHTASSTAKTLTASGKTAAASSIPKVAGIPKTLYALKYIDTKVGAGPLAEQRKYYTVRYTGWLKNGTKFDSSYDHPGGEPITFPYGAHRVITGWDTGFEGMHVGGKRRLLIPYQLAYGEAGRPPVIPAKSDLIFDLELVGQSDTPPPSNQPTPPPTGTPTPQPPAQPQPQSQPQPKPAEPAPGNPPDTSARPSPSPSPSPSKPETQPATPPHPESR